MSMLISLFIHCKNLNYFSPFSSEFCFIRACWCTYFIIICQTMLGIPIPIPNTIFIITLLIIIIFFFLFLFLLLSFQFLCLFCLFFFLFFLNQCIYIRHLNKLKIIWILYIVVLLIHQWILLDLVMK